VGNVVGSLKHDLTSEWKVFAPAVAAATGGAAVGLGQLLPSINPDLRGALLVVLVAFGATACGILGGVTALLSRGGSHSNWLATAVVVALVLTAVFGVALVAHVERPSPRTSGDESEDQNPKAESEKGASSSTSTLPKAAEETSSVPPPAGAEGGASGTVLPSEASGPVVLGTSTLPGPESPSGRVDIAPTSSAPPSPPPGRLAKVLGCNTYGESCDGNPVLRVVPTADPYAITEEMVVARYSTGVMLRALCWETGATTYNWSALTDPPDPGPDPYQSQIYYRVQTDVGSGFMSDVFLGRDRNGKLSLQPC
jgi:hypothetical protein